MVAKVKVFPGLWCQFCGKKLGDYLDGCYRTTCPRCHRPVHFDTRALDSPRKV